MGCNRQRTSERVWTAMTTGGVQTERSETEPIVPGNGPPRTSRQKTSPSPFGIHSPVGSNYKRCSRTDRSETQENETLRTHTDLQREVTVVCTYLANMGRCSSVPSSLLQIVCGGWGQMRTERLERKIGAKRWSETLERAGGRERGGKERHMEGQRVRKGKREIPHRQPKFISSI